MRRPMTWKLWMLFVLLFVWGCGDDPSGPGPGDPSDPDGGAGRTVSGTVTNQASSAPVAGAVVRIGDTTVTTGSDGRFELTNLPEGTVTLRCTAPGYTDFEEIVTVTSSVVVTQIALTRIEVFELGDFTLYVPPTVEHIRAILVALGGPNTKGFATGEPFGAPVAEVEASLQTLGESFRQMAATRGLAILGTSISGMADGAESDQKILAAVRAAAEPSGRPDLATAPVLMYGLSGGGPQASGFTARHPERVAGLFLKVPAGVTTLTGGEALKVPTFVVLAEQDAIVDTAAITAAFEANRRAGALWAMATEPGVIHHSLSPAQRQLTLFWMSDVLSIRIPTIPGLLHEVVETAGWLGDPSTGEVSSWAVYSGNREAANWLPTQAAAERWQDFANIDHPLDPDVSGVYDLTAVSVGTDPAWGPPTGTRLTAVLTIRRFAGLPRFGGTYDEFCVTYPGGASTVLEPPYGSGFVSGTIDGQGHVVVDLFPEGYGSPGWTWEGTLASGRIEGTYWDGTFTIERRAEAPAIASE